jgi:cytochrome c oxidase subunit IV
MAQYSPADASAAHADVHPGPRKYVMIGLVLFILTIAEVAAYYIDALAPVLLPLLLILSAAKFILVVQWYMHLKFDSKVLTAVFVGPMALAVLVIISLVILFRILPEFKLL